jgi:hypothetical protein
MVNATKPLAAHKTITNLAAAPNLVSNLATITTIAAHAAPNPVVPNI